MKKRQIKNKKIYEKRKKRLFNKIKPINSLYQIVICNGCNKEYTALVENVKLGKSKFCTKICSIKYKMKNKTITIKICKYCSTTFKTLNFNTLYCSIKCCNKNKVDKRKLTFKQKEKVIILKTRGCEICKWKKASCDIHHIKSIAKGGTNRPSNLITLCPNHHRMADQGKVTIISLFTLVKKRKKKIGF